jgi:raffinose/stachyose/melibiose transport system substrate-binding protein
MRNIERGRGQGAHRSRSVLVVAPAAVAASLVGVLGGPIGNLAQASASPGASGACPATPASITVWLSDAGSAGNALFNKTAASFEKACPGDKVTIEVFTNTAIVQKTSVAMSANRAPTVFFSWGGGVLQTYVDAGKVYSLNSAFSQDPAWKSDFLSSALGPVTYNGKVYGVPNEGTQPVLLFYNKPIFAKLHLSPPSTWSGLMSDISAIKAAGLVPMALGNEDYWSGLMYLEYLADRIGGPSVYNALQANKPGAWSQPAIAQALADIQQLVKAGAFEPGFDAISESSNEPDALFYSGKAAMELMGSWLTGTIYNDDRSFLQSGGVGWTAFPTVPGGKGNSADLVGNVATYFAVSSNATTAQKAVAVAWMKDELSTHAYAEAAAGVGDIPVIAGADHYFGGTLPTGYEDWIYSAVTNAPHFQYSWDEALGSTKATPLYENLGKVFELSETPSQFAAAMNKYQ